jgi:hypothetical protein
MKTLLALLTFLVSYLYIGFAMAQEAVAPVAAPTGIMGWIAAHGGFQASILILVGSSMALASALRTVLLYFDGVPPGADIPPGLTGLTTVNKVCVVLGKVLDFIQGNLKH